MSKVIKEERVSGGLGRCILPMLDALGWKGGQRTFLNALPYDYRNFSTDDMMNTMANLGYRVSSSGGTLDNLDERLLPCLFIDAEDNAHVLLNTEKEGYFSYKGDPGEFIIIEPGKREGKFYFFKNLAESSRNPEREQSNWFSTFIVRFRKPLLTALFISLLVTLSALAMPFVVMGIYSQINTADSLTGFWIIGAGILFLLLMDLAMRLFRDWILGFIGSRMGFLVSTQVFKRILSFSPSATENAPVGSQIVRMRDFNSVKSFIEGPAMTSVLELPFLEILFIGLIFMAGPLALVPVGAFIILFFFTMFILPFVRKINSETAESASKKQAYLIELFSEFKDIRMSGLSRRWIENFEKISAESAVDIHKTTNINSLINNVSQGIVTIAGALTISLGVYGVLNREYSGAVLIAAMMLVWKILSPISSGFTVMSQTIRIRKSLQQLNRLMGMKLEPSSDNSIPVKFNGKINFKGVSLRYKPDYYPALLGIDLSIKKGEFVIIKGHDGAGKSTLFKLILGMYKAQAGTITIDETNIQQLPPTVLRRSIAYLPQEDVLFNVGITKNMKYASPTSGAGDIERVLEKLDLIEDINGLPEQLETPVTQLNSIPGHLSVKKRLCIARTLLNDSNIILLDEPDRGLEKKDIERLVGILSELKSEKTILLNTNNPEFTKLADKIVTLNIGTLAKIEKAENRKEDGKN